jgi:hypothetical protein
MMTTSRIERLSAMNTLDWARTQFAVTTLFHFSDSTAAA